MKLITQDLYSLLLKESFYKKVLQKSGKKSITFIDSDEAEMLIIGALRESSEDHNLVAQDIVYMIGDRNLSRFESNGKTFIRLSKSSRMRMNLIKIWNMTDVSIKYWKAVDRIDTILLTYLRWFLRLEEQTDSCVIKKNNLEEAQKNPKFSEDMDMLFGKEIKQIKEDVKNRIYNLTNESKDDKILFDMLSDATRRRSPRRRHQITKFEIPLEYVK